MSQSIVLDIDDRGRISVGKLFGSVKQLIATVNDTGQVTLTPAVVVPTMMPSIMANAPLMASIKKSLSPDQPTVAYRRRTKPLG